MEWNLILHLIRELKDKNNELHAMLDLLQNKNKKYNDLFQLSPIGHIILNKEGIISQINQSAAELFGVEKEFMINKNLIRYIDPAYHKIFRQNLNRSAVNSLHSSEFKFLKRKASTFYAKLTSKIYHDNESQKPQTLVMLTDCSYENQKTAQNGLFPFERLISHNKLASILAHEINTPISVIANYLHGIINRLKNNAFKINELVEVLERSSAQIKYISEIILRMKGFSCENKMQMSLYCINELMNEAIVFINYEVIDYPVHIKYRPFQYSKMIFIDKIHIQQVILNIARNAIEAMQEAQITEPRLIIEVDLIKINLIQISIHDNGPGIRPDKMHRIFDLHFTTKPYGTGLGLALSRSIIEAHGGNLIVNNNYHGASVKFTLPIDPYQ